MLRTVVLLNLAKVDEAKQELAQLGSEEPSYAPALFKLARMQGISKEPGNSQPAIGLYRKYSQLEPYDPRPHLNLARLFEELKQPKEQEIELRKVLELRPEYEHGNARLLAFLMEQGRPTETQAVFARWEKSEQDSVSLFNSALQLLYFGQNEEMLAFLKLYPQHFKGNFAAHMTVAGFLQSKSYDQEALRILTIAKQLDKTSASPYISSSAVLRSLSRWPAALREADQAVVLDAKSADAHYERACSLAKLRRPKEALAALAKAIELDEEYAEFLAEEEDLKPLAALPGFKKLLPKE